MKQNRLQSHMLTGINHFRGDTALQIRSLLQHMANREKNNENQMSRSLLVLIPHTHNPRMLCRCRFGFKGNS